jgi:hypothetical protein
LFASLKLLIVARVDGSLGSLGWRDARQCGRERGEIVEWSP